MKEWIKYQLSNKHLTMPILSFPSIQLMGVNMTELVQNSDYQVKGMQLIAEQYPTSACLSFMDLSIEAEAFGASVRYSDNEVPSIIGSIASCDEDVDSLVVPHVTEGRVAIALKTIRKASQLIANKPVFGGVIGPYSLAGRIMDMTELMINCYESPDLVHKLIAKCTQFITKYIQAIKANGAQGVIMAEPAAGLLSYDLCEEFSSCYIKKIVEAVSDDNFIFTYHNCGNVIPLAESIKSINADVYHFGNAIDINKMLELMPSDKVVMGNIDPLLIKNGKLDDVKQSVISLLNKCDRYDNFVISSGCDIPPDSDWKNIRGYFDAINQFYKLKGLI